MNPALLNHLERLVAFQPISNNQAAVQSLLNYVHETLLKLPFKDITLHDNNGIYSLTASTAGTKRPRILLQGHVDVVSAPTSLQYDNKDDKVYGRGVFDMLFATASYLTFLEDNKASLPGLNIGLMLTGDEELGGLNGVKALIDQGYSGEVCILPDAGAGYGDLSVAAKGSYQFTLVVNGAAHHGSRPWEGDGAGNKLVVLLYELMQFFDMSDPENSTITIARLAGGDADNKGPSSTSARIDIRYKDQADFVRIQNRVKDLCLQYDASVEELDIGDSYEIDLADQNIQDFMALYEQHYGAPITNFRAPGSSDARFFAAHNIPVIMLRPDGFGAHGDNEWLSVRSFNKYHALIEEYLLSYGN